MSYLRNTRSSFRTPSKNDGVTILLSIDGRHNEKNVARFFNNLAALRVKRVILLGEFRTIREFLDTHRREIQGRLPFEYALVFRPDLPTYLRENIQKIDSLLLPRLFCNSAYFKRHALLTKPIFHFFDLRPEVFPIDSPGETVTLTIKNVGDVDSVFLITEAQQGNIYDEVTDISDQLDVTSGVLNLKAINPPKGRVIVLRRYYADSQTPLSYFFNYYDATAFAALQKWFKAQVVKLPIPINGVLYNLEEMFDVTQNFNGVAYSPNLEKVLKGIKKTLAFYYANAQEQPIHNIFLSIVFKRYFNSMLRPRFNVLSPQVRYLLRPESSLARLLDLNQQFVINPDVEQFEFETPYFWTTVSSLKRAESQRFAETDERLPVLAHQLLHSPFTIPEQKFHIDLLAQAGATEFWWNAQIDDRIITDTQHEFLLNKIKYTEQLGAFLSRGLPAGQILMLYPSLDQTQNVFQKILRNLHLSGVQFELVNFDLFNSNQYCKIENGKINFNQKSFTLVVLPAIQIIPYATLKKLLSFFSRGGQIVAIQKIPAQVERRDKQKSFEKIRQNLWIVEPDMQSITFLQDENGGKSWFVPKLHLLKDFLTSHIQNETVYVECTQADILIRTRETHEAYFIFMTNPSSKETCRLTLHSHKKGFPFYWDFKKQIQKPLHFWNWQEGHLTVPLTLRPKESKLIILQKELSTNVWHIGFCDAEECHVFSPKTGTFVVQMRNPQNKAVELFLEKGEKRLKVPVNIKEKLPPLYISPDHWILLADKEKQIIHLDDLPRIALQLNTPPILQKTFVLRRFRRDQSYYLDLGRVQHPCIVKINGQIGGRLWHHPFRIDISALLQPAENTLEISFIGLTSLQHAIPQAEFAFPDPLRIIPYQKIFIRAEELEDLQK